MEIKIFQITDDVCQRADVYLSTALELTRSHVKKLFDDEGKSIKETVDETVKNVEETITETVVEKE